jgi:hypothetical protein
MFEMVFTQNVTKMHHNYIHRIVLDVVDENIVKYLESKAKRLKMILFTVLMLE